jgi:hypothetical protein
MMFVEQEVKEHVVLVLQRLVWNIHVVLLRGEIRLANVLVLRIRKVVKTSISPTSSIL